MKKLFAIGTAIIAMVGLCMIGKMMWDTYKMVDGWNTQIEDYKKEYEEGISNFNEDEMDILEQYGGYLAGYAYGFRSTVEEGDQIVTDEHVYVVKGIYTLVINTLDGGQFVYEFEKAS